MNRTLFSLIAVLALSACGKDEAPANNATTGDTGALVDDGNGGDDQGGANNNAPDLGAPDLAAPDMDAPDMPSKGSCNRMPRTANGPRKVVVAHPFTDTMYEVLDLDAAGELSRPNVTFNMGAGHEGQILFTPDGVVGFAVQEQGTLGVFRLNASGQPEVLAGLHDPGFYVSGAVLDATGDNLYAWETGWRKTDDGTHNGALYRLPIGCATGLPEEAVELLRGKLIRGASWTSPSRLALAAVDVIDIETPDDAHLVDLAGPTRVASISAFPDDEAISAGFATTHDGLYMLVGDNSAFSGIPNRLGVIGIQGDQLFAQQTFEMPDPVAIVTSPFNNAAIVLSTVDDNIHVLGYNPGAAVSAFTNEGPLATTQPVLLPIAAAMIERGDLEGLVLVSENVGVRRVRFEQNGDVSDLGLLEFGPGIESIAGAIGVQP